MSEHSEQINDLAKALAAAQGEFTSIPKSATNPFFKSKYADLPAVMAVATPVLSKHGLAVSQFIGTDTGGDTLTTWLIHESGQFINETMRLHLVKDDAQSQGSATTYARRYSYMSVLGLVADVDDDGQAATNASRRRQQEQPSGPPPLPPGTMHPNAAKKALVHRAENLGLDEAAAKTVAIEAWGNRGMNPVASSELALMLDAVTDAIADSEEQPSLEGVTP